MEWFTPLFEHRVTVYGPPTTTRDDGGGEQVTWPTVRQANVACVLKVDGAGEQDLFGQKQFAGSVSGASLYLGVQPGDKLIVTAGKNFVNTSVHVTSIQVQPGVDFLGIDSLLTFVGRFIR